MISKTKTREILGKTKLSNEQLEGLRREMYALAEIFLEEILTNSGSKKNSWVIDSTTNNNGH
jgi:hypothetical protein